MQTFHTLSIQRKQMLVIMLTSVLVLLLACGAFVTYEVTAYRGELTKNLATLAQIIGDNSSGALDFNDTRGAQDILSALRAEPNIVAACLYSKDARPFATYLRPDAPASFSIPKPQGDSYRIANGHLVLFHSIAVKGDKVGTICLESDLSNLTARLRRYAAIAGIVLLGSVLLAFLLSSQLQRLLSRPILDLARTARAVALQSDYSLRAVKRSGDELGMLTDDFNQMLSQIQERDVALHAAKESLEKRVVERTHELENSLSLLHAAIESTVGGILVVDPQGKVVTYNKKFASMWRIPEAVLSSGDDSQLLAAVLVQLSDPDGFMSKVVELYAHPDTESLDTIEFKDGRVFERYSLPQRIRNEIVGRVWNFRDITEHKRAEEALQESEGRLRVMWDSMQTGIMVIDPATHRVVDANPVAVRLIGAPREEIVGALCHKFICPAGQGSYPVTDLGQTVDNAERILLTANGGRISILKTVTSITLGGRQHLLETFVDITERKRAEAKVENLHRQLLDTSRQAGMAEVATNVLHNVGNVLNSVNVSVALVSDKIRKSRISNLAKAARLLEEHRHDLPAFFASDPKGTQLPGYLIGLAQHLTEEQAEVFSELQSLTANVEHIKEIVAMQQSYSKVSGVVETLPVIEMIEDALRMNAAALTRHEVHVVREYAEVPPVIVERHKVLQILVNLIRNAKYALDDGQRQDKQLTLRVAKNGSDVVDVSVIDNGVGIPLENLNRIFEHGFTTRKSGHGFGLHSGALAAKQIGGTLTVCSDGVGKGATFTLTLPCTPKEEKP